MGHQESPEEIIRTSLHNPRRVFANPLDEKTFAYDGVGCQWVLESVLDEPAFTYTAAHCALAAHAVLQQLQFLPDTEQEEKESGEEELGQRR